MAGKLKPLDVARQTTPGKYPDGDGLYLVVAGATSRNWSYRYWIGGKERWHGLGSLQEVSLKDARVRRDTARQQVRAGVDIVQAKRSAREVANAVEAATTAPTFRQCADRYIEDHRAGWSKKHADQWPSSLAKYAYPTIGHLRIDEIMPSHIYELLAPIWISKRETSNRVRGRIETIIAKNVDIDDNEFRNPAELTKQLREKLPKRPKHKPRHHPALPYAEMPEFMTKLSAAEGRAAKALRFVIYTVCRTNEVLGAAWDEIDRPTTAWRIPAVRMKMGEEHSVPLTAPALAILDEARDGTQGDLIFPSEGDQSFSDMAMLAVLDRLGYSHITVHGFRATFGTWAEECTDYPDGVREAALAHKYKNDTVAAYQRGAKLEKRRALMADWARFISSPSISASMPASMAMLTA
ncbi:integrase arm-type DNA-binding domain-containing protein [Tardiphaga sp.]|uniref:tyrosine-type recombinase/integrase n=1 Tax=Tardiphaga sp. TaxID=1926292 RepID=UPI00262E2559|nr:integrase arm-type DNA-binding domain-containing protein [Tardiphaga sp.]MDB5616590.1 Integrase [Tardiphaga sp.]